MYTFREKDFEVPLPHRHQEVQGCISATMGPIFESSNPSVMQLQQLRCACLSREICVNLCSDKQIANGSSSHTDPTANRQWIKPASQLYSQAIKYLAKYTTPSTEKCTTGQLVLHSVFPARTYQL